MRSRYEEEIRAMEDRIREAEMDRERDRINKASRTTQDLIHLDEIDENPQLTKPHTLMNFIDSWLCQSQVQDQDQAAHVRTVRFATHADVSKIANEKRTLAENQLRTLRVAVETLKAEKQHMIKRMKEDADRIKEMNAAND
ncbi:hypothetical protein BGX26_009110, partial [Mortierella sp. AD094]